MMNSYKESVRAAAYLGPRGWTVPKAALSAADLEDLRRTLMIKKKPAAGAPPAEEVVVPAFRESAAKIYLPRFFAEERYGGPAARSKVGDGVPIDIHFQGNLRPEQTRIVESFKEHIGDGAAAGGGGLLSLRCGGGKTVLAINIMCHLRVKTLVIVHKEFLLNQWIERITEYARRADGTPPKIGRIQGEKFDIEGCDIVIGMLQSLYNKEFGETAFSEFGLLVVDECHRIAAEMYSRALFKLCMKYSLGISATIERKDGMECLLNHFLGPIFYRVAAKQEHAVLVRAIEFESGGDKEYEEVETDWRGKVKYASLLSKIMEYGPRRAFCVRVIQDLFEENPHKQIMVLGQYKEFLHYIFDEITAWGGATVGMYVGGMKKRDLVESESKNIICASYAYASEGLDIPSLSTLVMVSPKTDIEQSVGRILRTKGNDPIVVDIVDCHDTFKSQWAKRRRFYKAANYDIVYAKSGEYRGPAATAWRAVAARVEAAESEDDSAAPRATPKKGVCLL